VSVPLQTTQTEEKTLEKPKRLNRKSVHRFREEEYLRNLPDLMKALWPAFIKGCRDGNPQMVRMAAEVAGVMSKKDGPLVSLTLGMQQTNIQTDPNGPTSLEQLIRKLDSRERDAGAKPVVDLQRA
jgi:hypothetical protein